MTQLLLLLAIAGAYDPSDKPKVELPKPIELTVKDTTRDGREIPILVYLPTASDKPAVTLLFSHGLGGSRTNAGYLAEHWAARGYAVVCLQHPGSDESVWRDKPLGERMAAMRQAAGAANFLLRVKDVPAVLDQLEKWHKEPGHALAGKLKLDKVGMSGHSFGAVTTQAVSGQSAARGAISFTDKRIAAAIAFSPSTPKLGDPKAAFAQVKIPWLLMTGTLDTSPIGDQTVESRLAVFPALPAGNKYEVVLDKAEHSAFGQGRLPGEKERRNPNHHRVILALSTAFWDAYLRDDPAAKEWLDGEGPLGVLEKADRWQKK